MAAGVHGGEQSWSGPVAGGRRDHPYAVLAPAGLAGGLTRRFVTGLFRRPRSDGSRAFAGSLFPHGDWARHDQEVSAMKGVIVRYKIKPDQAARNEELVRAVYDELDRTKPAGLRYATFQLDDGVSFVHLAWTETADGTSPLSAVEAFKRFQEDIDDRTEERPVVTELREIGSYRLFGE